MRTTSNKFKRHSGGFAILEALVGLVVLAFGMLALSSFQSTLSLHSDIAKQRSEATRIAQWEIDTLRAFRQRSADGTPGGASLTYLEDVNTVIDRTFPSTFTNATFTVKREVTVPAGDRYRWVRVAVTWFDRTGQTRDVVMNTVVSDGDPGDLGALGVGRNRSMTLKPKNRNINIPYPAVGLSGGQTSAFIPPPGNVAFVFDNTTGDVVSRCTSASQIILTEAIDLINTSGVTCTSLDAYLLSGYVRFKTSGAQPTAAYLGAPNTDLTDPTQPLLPDDPATIALESPLFIDSDLTLNAPSAYECYSQQQRTWRNNSLGFEVTIPEGNTPPTGYNNEVARLIAYTCIVTPVDHDSDTATAKRWSGEVKLVPTTGTGAWAFGTSSSQYRVCRASGDYNRNGVLSNHEHPRYYRHVTGALDNQNYLVVKGSDYCPSDVRSDPVAGDFLDTNTALHQPTEDAVLSFWCSIAACSGPHRKEYEFDVGSVGAFIPME